MPYIPVAQTGFLQSRKKAKKLKANNHYFKCQEKFEPLLSPFASGTEPLTTDSMYMGWQFPC